MREELIFIIPIYKISADKYPHHGYQDIWKYNQIIRLVEVWKNQDDIHFESYTYDDKIKKFVNDCIYFDFCKEEVDDIKTEILERIEMINHNLSENIYVDLEQFNNLTKFIKLEEIFKYQGD